VDVIGRPLRLVLTPGNTSDIRGADLLVEDAVRMKRMIADRGYDANKLRTTLKGPGHDPIIPGPAQPQAADPV
jgi:Transposase DDE domain.